MQIILNLAGGNAPVSNEVEVHLLGLKDIKVTYTSKNHCVETTECPKPLVQTKHR